MQIPCWDSYRIDPRKWRGVCFGRTLSECYWTGLRQIRWARTAYGGALGTEYLFPVQNVGSHGYLSDIQALCWLYFSMSCLFSLGIGQVFSLCGNIGCNFGACYSCHAREKMRRRFHLPPAFGLPPGIDDCVVHFLCFYCSSHQELRELVVRGIDGPGLHILDVLPNSFRKVEGYDSVIGVRHAIVQEMVAQPPHIFQSRMRRQVKGDAQNTGATAPPNHPVMSVDGSNLEPGEAMGWRQLCCPDTPPPVQSMDRTFDARTIRRSHSAELAQSVSSRGDFHDNEMAESQGIPPRRMERAWSIAY